MSSPVNGQLTILIPNKLLIFEAPNDDIVDAAGRRDYEDVSQIRYFSSVFYADLLSELGAELVVSFNSECDSVNLPVSEAAFTAAGLDYCCIDDRSGGPGHAMSLESLDRFITLAAGCPGLVAVQCRSDLLRGGVTATHLAALLLSQRHFATTVEALAWIQMVRPGRASAPVELELLHLARRTGLYRSPSLGSPSEPSPHQTPVLPSTLTRTKVAPALAAAIVSRPGSATAGGLAPSTPAAPSLPGGGRRWCFRRGLSTSSPDVVSESSPSADPDSDAGSG